MAVLRHLIPYAAIQHATGAALERAAPLLEEERHVGPKRTDCGCHGPSFRSGIYLGAGAERPDPAKGNTVEGNEIAGYGMSRHCVVAAPGVSLAANKVAKNECSDEAAIARVRLSTRR